MTGYDEYERPFKMDPNPELNRLSDLPEWKEPEYPNPENWETEDSFPTTDFTVPTYTDREDWW